MEDSAFWSYLETQSPKFWVYRHSPLIPSCYSLLVATVRAYHCSTALHCINQSYHQRLPDKPCISHKHQQHTLTATHHPDQPHCQPRAAPPPKSTSRLSSNDYHTSTHLLFARDLAKLGCSRWFSYCVLRIRSLTIRYSTGAFSPFTTRDHQPSPSPLACLVFPPAEVLFSSIQGQRFLLP